MTLQSGDFDALTKFCEERNMQMLVLETWDEYKFIADYIKKSKHVIMTIAFDLYLDQIGSILESYIPL